MEYQRSTQSQSDNLGDVRAAALLHRPNIAKDPHEYWVSVLSPGKTAYDCCPSDFTWFKCRPHHTISTIRNHYKRKTSKVVQLKVAALPIETNRIQPEDTKIQQLDYFGDTLVVFSVVDSERTMQSPGQGARAPLPPTSAQITSKPHGSPSPLNESPSRAAENRRPLGNLKVTTSPTIKAESFSTMSHLSHATSPPIQNSSPFVKSETRRPRLDSYSPAGSPNFPPSLHTDSSSNIENWKARLHSISEILRHKASVSAPRQKNIPPGWNPHVKSVSSPSPSTSPYVTPYPTKSESPRCGVDAGSSISTDRKMVDPYTYKAQASGLVEAPSVQIPENSRIQEIIAHASPAALEKEVQNSLRVLHDLKKPMITMAQHDAQATQWIRQIESLQTHPMVQPTIIGVVGNTGAGKSSVINAMLDEERLVPTNCMRACTAVVTSLAWNESNDANAKYRAEIEFIKPEDWERELNVLASEILDSAGNVSKDIYNAESEAGVAYAKIKAVYPDMSKEDIIRTKVADMMLKPAVASVLGSTKKIGELSSETFYKRLQHYVDSKEKVTKALKKGDKKGEKKEMEFWPLIKIVRIFTKSDALSTGAVVVDLPGVHDSNAARAQVAQNYIKQCTGLWIVAPINRAVDDKAAKSLLGESFKRQLKYDGTYSRVTFICSKTDDISVTEASDSLGLADELAPKWNQIDEIDSSLSRLQKQHDELKKTKSLYGEVISKIDDDLEIWDKLKDDLEEGKVVFAPATKKRKRPSGHSSGSSDSDVDNDFDASSRVESDGDEMSSSRQPLTEDEIKAKIAELKLTKKDARTSRRELDTKISDSKDEAKTLTLLKDSLEAEMNAVCITGRNNYSKGAIQQDFAAGIKELDQENAAEEDEENFNPDEDIRDYEEVARSLPVFCVSSRAYQKLSGRLKKDKGVPGFVALEETEVPQLQAHCKKLTEAARTLGSRRFLNSFSQLCNSLALWASNDGSGINLTDAQMATEANYLKLKLAQLGRDLETAVEGCLTDMKESLSENIYDKFDNVVQTAINQASTTALKWGSPINRQNRAAGGVHWGTFRAIVRRNGVYSNAQGLHDFNSQLTEPIMMNLASNWEKAFARRLPAVLAGFSKRTKVLLESFHQSVENRVVGRGTSAAGILMLGQQLQNYEQIFLDLTVQMTEVINALQREANREFTPIIAQRLANAYALSASERGTGSHARMTSVVKTHIDTEKHTMFYDCTQGVKDRLTQMCRSVEQAMSDKADEVFLLMRRDYITAITGSHVPQGQELPKWQRHIMADVSRILAEMDEDEGDKTNEVSNSTKASTSSTMQNQEGSLVDPFTDEPALDPFVDPFSELPVPNPAISLARSSPV